MTGVLSSLPCLHFKVAIHDDSSTASLPRSLSGSSPSTCDARFCALALFPSATQASPVRPNELVYLAAAAPTLYRRPHSRFGRVVSPPSPRSGHSIFRPFNPDTSPRVHPAIPPLLSLPRLHASCFSPATPGPFPTRCATLHRGLKPADLPGCNLSRRQPLSP